MVKPLRTRQKIGYFDKEEVQFRGFLHTNAYLHTHSVLVLCKPFLRSSVTIFYLYRLDASDNCDTLMVDPEGHVYIISTDKLIYKVDIPCTFSQLWRVISDLVTC